ncbi:phytoene/squalene synthase family protein [Alkalitalea saponilacus]|uniref:Phytoene/squalene synthetase n=1 Tax=Alkalitalea saponilacus TaxID=889453 RepID=A0A1T5CEC7_9BACT|nr:phytoene/squalene synthase family protein [Alkalitalea saponilacus]ASB49840.1 phytoene synthase [Alkalitalea saponilacus]SKB57794.1 Phytoene/squalene synthetase [Alkalitalea saponilacus]
MNIYRKNNLKCSISTTRLYSTSFSLGVRMLDKEYRNHIYSIYGFVRYADEIVDTFLEHDRQTLLNEFRDDTWKAIERGISLNPILDSFQHTVNECKIDYGLITAFLDSMEMDLNYKTYTRNDLEKYIYGSAEVVGLMCLRVFYVNDDEEYNALRYPARKLGEAFQKVNFLRDAQDDYQNKGRIYFKDIDFNNFTPEAKQKIEKEIQSDFDEAFKGIVRLKPQVRLGVYLAYRYYLNLFHKIKFAKPEAILKQRYRVSNPQKGVLMFKASLRNAMGLF